MRVVLWTNFLQHSAVLPWIRTVIRLAQAAEDAEAYRSALASEARCLRGKKAMAERLWEDSPHWCAEIPALAPWQPRRGSALLADAEEDEA